MADPLYKVLMERDELTMQEALDIIKEMKDRVKEGEDPEEILYDEGLEPDYLEDIL